MLANEKLSQVIYGGSQGQRRLTCNIYADLSSTAIYRITYDISSRSPMKLRKSPRQALQRGTS